MRRRGATIGPPCRAVAIALTAFATVSMELAAAGGGGAADWKSAAPEAAGFDSALLAQAVGRIRMEEPHTHAVVLVADGRMVLDASFWPYAGREPHNLASVTKSVMTTLIAIADAQGMLDLDRPMLDFFADRNVAHLNDRKRRITVRHLTGMVSGLACVGEHDEPTLHQMNASPDWVQFTLDLPMAAEPGAVFSYCSPGMHLLSAILQSATGRTAFDFARENLLGPLGISEADWPADPQGVTHGWGDLRLLPEQAARIGQLWLDGGVWEGERIVPEEWVRESSRLQTTTGEYWGDNYGYGWWVMTGDEIPQFAASGRGGQRVGVFPSLGLVAVTVGGGIDPGHVLDLLGTALVSPGEALPENPEGLRALEAVIEAARQPPPAGLVAPLPPLAAEISGRTWRFHPNPLGIETLRVTFDGTDDAGIAITFAGGMPPIEGRMGLDGVLRTFPGEDGVTAGMRGAWVSESEFRAEYDGIAQIDAFDLALHFEGDQLVMQAKDRTYEAGVTLKGRGE
jgi:CubicO group peptidase (beta-lactamase class C family)